MATPKIRTVEVGCPKCGASGHFGDESRAQDNPFCPQCIGRGKISVPLDQAHPCPDCKGRGHVENVPCSLCAHSGKVSSLTVGRDSVAPSNDPRDAIVADLKKEIVALKTQLAELERKR